MKGFIKNFTCKIICIILLQGLVSNAFAHVYLDHPLGGETFEANTIITIQWYIAIPHEQLNWDLLFSTDGGNTWQPIQWDLPVSQLTYTWVVPNISTSMARISIIQDNVGMDYQDETTDFTILPASLAPFIDISAHDTIFECSASNQQSKIQAWLNDHGGALAISQCNNLTWTNDFYALTNECGITGAAYVTFTAADECGSTSTSAYLTVMDTHAPVMQVPANDMVVECGNPNNTAILNNWLANHGGAVASEDCSSIIWTFQANSPSNGCGNTSSTLVVFTATDQCGNNSTTSAIFSVEDRLVPNMAIPAQDYSISCATPDKETILQNWINTQGGAYAVDNCGNITWTNNYSTLSDGCGPTGNALVTFTATDDCGNISTTSANFAIVDNVAPVINVIARDTTIHCEDINALTDIQNWLSNHGGATASDDCGSVSWTNDFPTLADTCNETRIIPVNFIVSDECNITNTTMATITLLSTVGTTDVNSEYFKISPNPASDVLKITFDKTEILPVRIFIFDTWGRMVLSKHEIETEIYISVNEYTPGIYLVQVESAKWLYSQKVIID